MFARRSCRAKYHDHELDTTAAFRTETRGQRMSRPEWIGKAFFRISELFRNQADVEGQHFGCKGRVQQAWLHMVSLAKPHDDDVVRSRRVFARRSCSAKYDDNELATASAVTKRNMWPTIGASLFRISDPAGGRATEC